MQNGRLARRAPGRQTGATSRLRSGWRPASRRWQSSPGRPPVEFAWDQLLARLLAGAVAVLVLCAAVELPHFRDAQPLQPGIENAVAQLVWSL